jgi:phosphonate transport system substrate-binding protein
MSPAPRREKKIIFFSSLALLAACAGNAAAPGAAAAPSGKTFAFGFMSPTGATAAAASAARLTEDLTKALGQPVTAMVFPTPRELAEALAQGRVDAAWMSPGSYVVAARAGEVEPILKLSRGGFGRYRSVFFTKAGANIASLEQAKGHSLALVHGASMSGHLFPLAHLKRKGIDAATYFSQILEGKDHEEVCRLVVDGKADIGVTLSDYRAPDELTPDGCVQGGMDPDAFSVFEAVGPIPNDVVAVRSSMSGSLKDKLRDSLMEMRRSEAGRGELHTIFHADGFVPANDTDFAAVRELEQFMGDVQ